MCIPTDRQNDRCATVSGDDIKVLRGRLYYRCLFLTVAPNSVRLSSNSVTSGPWMEHCPRYRCALKWPINYRAPYIPVMGLDVDIEKLSLKVECNEISFVLGIYQSRRNVLTILVVRTIFRLNFTPYQKWYKVEYFNPFLMMLMSMLVILPHFCPWRLQHLNEFRLTCFSPLFCAIRGNSMILLW